MRRALTFEIERQIQVLSAGGKLAQETRRWDDVRGETTLMRIKESSHDYRYFPDPDLIPVHTEKLVTEATRRIPELPQAKRNRFIRDYEISDYDAAVLTDDGALAHYFEAAVSAAAGAAKPKTLANWIINDLLSALGAASLALSEANVTPTALAELTALIEKGTISGRQGKEVFAEMMTSGKAPAMIVQEKGMQQVSDTGALEAFCDEAVAAHPAVVADFKAGKEAALNFLKGQVMKLSKGKANPAIVGDILKKKLS